VNSPSSVPPAIGRCAFATRCSDGLPSRGALGVGGIAPQPGVMWATARRTRSTSDRGARSVRRWWR
jgi:hypothetical protein